jgi:nucleoid-associated protein YgaU
MADKKADFSDVVAGSSSTAPPPAPDAGGGDRTYTVASGDSLSKIAQKLLGTSSRWREIYDLNRDRIKNPDLIQPGWVLKIPDA